MNHARSPLRLRVYIGAVVAGGIATFVVAWHASAGQALLGRVPAAVCVFVALLIVAEFNPLVLHGANEMAFTASLLFSFALLLVAPPVTCIGASIICSMGVEFAKRRPPVRVVFNSASLSIALGVAALLFRAVHDPTYLLAHPASAVWLTACVLVALVALVLNLLLTGGAMALSRGRQFRLVLRDMVDLSTAMEGLLLMMAPVFALVAVHGLAMVPMLALGAWAIYRSARVALSHRHDATHDPLTGLANRRMFAEDATQQVRDAERAERPLALLHLDLDNFKEINDQFGHAVGDLVLIEVADRLRANRLSEDLVARLGGDEFVVLIHGAEADGRRAAQNALTTLNAPFDVEGVPISIQGSFGVALFPDHGSTVPELLHSSDVAMYRAKTSHAGVHLYDEGVDRFGPTKLGLLGELTRAMNEEELFLLYQTQVDLKTGLITGAEALVRWEHPLRGLLQPTTFIPAAEQTDLVHSLTAYVLRIAAEQGAAWVAAGHPIQVAVNVSARNLHDLAFPDKVATILAECGLDPRLLEIEITENAVLTDPARTAVVLERLRSLGVGISIDDFGTGYSSLATLRSLPIDRLKIDRSFVSDMMTSPEDATIVRSIIELAQNLGIGTVAEGVENRAIATALQRLSCDTAQGYLVSHPSRAEDITPILDRPVRALVETTLAAAV